MVHVFFPHNCSGVDNKNVGHAMTQQGPIKPYIYTPHTILTVCGSDFMQSYTTYYVQEELALRVMCIEIYVFTN
jgi:hypothetical protein